MKSITELKNIYQGQTIWIVGTGPSLDTYPQDFLDDKISIGLNFAFRKFVCTYMMAGERRPIAAILSNPAFAKKSICSWPLVGEEAWAKKLVKPQAAEYGLNRDPEVPFDKENVKDCIDAALIGKDVLYKTHSSILFEAIWVALIMGCRDIKIIGCDFEKVGDREYCWEVEEIKSRGKYPPSVKENSYNLMMAGWYILMPALKERALNVERIKDFSVTGCRSTINLIEQEEKRKYTKAWECGAEGPSKCVTPLIKYISQCGHGKMLDIGCGNGVVAMALRDKDFDCYGLDITSAGLIPGMRNYFYEAPIWHMPFKDNEFDFTFSTDVLEHIPPQMVDHAIREIYRITKRKTFHNIATFEDNRLGFRFHLTVQPIEWWREKFARLNTKKLGLDIVLSDRASFSQQKDMKMIDITIATRGRPEQLKACINSLLRNTHKNILIWVVADGDEKATDSISEHLCSDPNLSFNGHVHIDRLPHSGLVFCQNWVVRNRVRFNWLQALDDLVFEKDALENALVAMEKYFPDGNGVIGLNQINIPANKTSIPLVGSEFMRRFSYKQPFYPGYYHFGGDTELGTLAMRLGKFHFCKEARVVHNHPGHSDRPVDETHRLARIHQEKDLELLRNRLAVGNLWGE